MTEEKLPWDETTFRVREWFKDKKFVLGTVENLAEIINLCIASGLYSLDLETTGLDNRVADMGGTPRTRDEIAGVCLSSDGITGYYIPLRHVKVLNDGNRVPLSCNVPLEVFDREFRRLIEATENDKTVAIFHNGKFDQEFLEYNGTGKPYGEWDKPKTWHDTEILMYLGDSRERDKRLKSLSKDLLGIDQVELTELYPEGYKGPMDFSTLDPTEPETLWYAGGDAICTRLLFDKLSPAVLLPDKDGKSQTMIYQIEKGCVAATRWMERNRIHIDRKKVKELLCLGQQEWHDAILNVYEGASKILGRNVMPGFYKVFMDRFVADDPYNLLTTQIEVGKSQAQSQYPDPQGQVHKEIEGKTQTFPPIYDVNSQQQLGQLFLEMGVPDLERTEKSGQIKTKNDTIDKIVEEHGEEFPFMKKVKRFREVSKALSTYLIPMFLGSDPNDDTMRINFRAFKVDTGRFSTPASDDSRKRLVGWPAVNLQAIPRSSDPKRPPAMTRLRECIAARVGKYLVAIDYAGVELRLVTNLSHEPKWLNEFFHCSGCQRMFDRGNGEDTPPPPPPRCPNCGSDKIGDLHTLTALSIFGNDSPSKPEWKELRGKAKSTNFALCYGGGGHAVCRATGVDKNEGGRIKNQFDAIYKGLKHWWDNQRDFARKYKFVRTAFGRKYPVPDIDSPDRGFKSKAERNAVNGPIQGTSADITKASMALIFKEMKKRGWLDRVQMIITMHDELVFEIDAEVLEEAIEIIKPLMINNTYIRNRNWPIPLTCDVEMGHDWSVPWDLNAMRFKEVRFIGGKKIKEKKKLPPGSPAWDTLSSWPDELHPWFHEARGEAAVVSAPLMEQVPAPVAAPVAVSVAPPATVPEAPPVAPSPAPAETGSIGDSGSIGDFVAEVLSEEQASPPLKPEVPPVSPQVQLRKDEPDLEPHGVYEYRLTSPLTLGTLERLAHVLVRCRGRGTNPLRLISRDGVPLDELLQHSPFNGQPILVNQMEFFYTARLSGL